MKFASEPLCPYCHEDRPSMVAATRDGRLVTWHCDACGKSWRPDCEHGYMCGCPHCKKRRSEPRTDVLGNEITGP